MSEKNNISIEGENIDFVITRTFNAPRELVFKAYSEAERLAQWWGPKEFTLIVNKLEFHPGGTFHYCMRSPDGKDMWGKFIYEDIIVPERIIFTNSFSDEQGNITRNPFAPVWPLEVHNVITFSEDNGKTTLNMRGRPINSTEEENRVFASSHKSLQQGYKGTLDKLEEYLAKA